MRLDCLETSCLLLQYTACLRSSGHAPCSPSICSACRWCHGESRQRGHPDNMRSSLSSPLGSASASPLSSPFPSPFELIQSAAAPLAPLERWVRYTQEILKLRSDLMQARAQFDSTQKIAQAQIDVLKRQVREGQENHLKLQRDILSLQQDLAEANQRIASLFQKLLSVTELVTNLELEFTAQCVDSTGLRVTIS